MLKRTKHSAQQLKDAQDELRRLHSSNNKYTVEFFAAQWARQKFVQQDVISATQKKLKKRVGVLLDLEEELLEAR